MSELIITHPGSAHFDEFFAICLILASFPETQFRVERREPTEDEINNPDIWVLDIGESLNPDLKNFDHHQDVNLQASFVLIANFLNLTDALKTLSWWDFKDNIDRFGPVKTGQMFGAKNLRSTYSPFEEWYLDSFSSDPMDSLPLMKRFGIHIIKNAKRLASQIKFWAKCKKIEINGKTVFIGHTDTTSGAEEFNSTLDKPAAALAAYDSRGKGWKLCRFDTSPEVDFSVLAGRDDIKFVHKTGFVAKTKERLPENDIIELIRLAIG